MAFEFVPLGNLLLDKGYIRGPFGSALKRGEMKETGTPVYEQQHAIDGIRKFRFFVDGEKLDELKRFTVKAHDLIISCSGTVGRISVISPSDPIGIISQALLILRPNLEFLLPTFLYYVLLSPQGQAELLKASHGAVQQNIAPRGVVEQIPIPLPDLEVQGEICTVLANIDDRITLLRETNGTLESIAQALFKSWFVDFDPVRAKMEGRTPEGMDEDTARLFPDELEESELGLVPRGWRIGTIGEMCAVTIGGLWGNDECDGAELVPAISLRGVDLEHLRVDGFAKNAPVRWVKPSAMEKRRLGENEVLIASSGAGPCGRTLWAGAGFEALFGMPVIFSNFVKRLNCGSPARAIYIDRLLAEMRETREIWNYINGTSIPNLDDKLLLATKKVVVPDNAILAAFESFARTIFQRLYTQEAQTLANLRDTLLPRLISGQLRLPEAEAHLEEVTT